MGIKNGLIASKALRGLSKSIALNSNKQTQYICQILTISCKHSLLSKSTSKE